jgi:hypothetical protein
LIDRSMLAFEERSENYQLIFWKIPGKQPIETAGFSVETELGKLNSFFGTLKYSQH